VLFPCVVLLLNLRKCSLISFEYQLVRIQTDSCRYEKVSDSEFGYTMGKDLSKTLVFMKLSWCADASWSTVRNIQRVGDIIKYQVLLVKSISCIYPIQEWWRISMRIKSPISKRYDTSYSRGIRNLDELTSVISANTCECQMMKDLPLLTKVYADMQDTLSSKF
jgi:hypothetical protein